MSPWVSARVCRLLARVGQFDEAESLAASLSDEQAKAWGRLEALRGRLEGMKGQKADDTWLDPIGEPSKSAAAAKGREVIARYNAAAGVRATIRRSSRNGRWALSARSAPPGWSWGSLDRDGK